MLSYANKIDMRELLGSSSFKFFTNPVYVALRYRRASHHDYRYLTRRSAENFHFVLNLFFSLYGGFAYPQPCVSFQVHAPSLRTYFDSCF